MQGYFGKSSGKGKTILLAEGDACVRILVREYLEANGFEVKDAGSASETLRLAGAWGGRRPDLLVTAAQLPDASGSWLAGVLKDGERPGLAVVYLVWEDLGVETLGGGARHVLKPFSFLQLHEAVEDALVAVEADSLRPRPVPWYGYAN